MLVLTRKPSEVIKLGDDVTITVVRTAQGHVKLGIEAPPHLRILRGELEEAWCGPPAGSSANR